MICVQRRYGCTALGSGKDPALSTLPVDFSPAGAGRLSVMPAGATPLQGWAALG